DLYELEKSSRATVRCPCFSVASWISWLRTPVCSRHTENPSIAPFWIEVSMYPFWHIYALILLASTEKKILPSTLSREMVRNWLICVDPRSFGTKHPSALRQLVGTVPLDQITRISFHSLRRSLGHLLYTL